MHGARIVSVELMGPTPGALPGMLIGGQAFDPGAMSGLSPDPMVRNHELTGMKGHMGMEGYPDMTFGK